MIDSLTIEATDTTPTVQLDGQQGQITIEGISDEEDALGFYFPVIQWLDAYQAHPADSTTLTIKLRYFNTASAKALYEIIKRLARIQKGGHSVTINWYYDEETSVLKDDIEHFSDIADVPINIIPA